VFVPLIFKLARITLHHKGLTFCQTLEFDISSNYRGKASVQCFIGVSNHTHLTKLAYSDWFITWWIINDLRSINLSPVWTFLKALRVLKFDHEKTIIGQLNIVPYIRPTSNWERRELVGWWTLLLQNAQIIRWRAQIAGFYHCYQDDKKKNSKNLIYPLNFLKTKCTVCFAWF